MTGETTTNTMGASHSGFSTSAVAGLGEAADVGRLECNLLDLGQRFDGLVSDNAASSLPAAAAAEAMATAAAFARTLAAGATPVTQIDTAQIHTGQPGPFGPGGEAFLFDLGAVFAATAAVEPHDWSSTGALVHPFADVLHIAFA